MAEFAYELQFLHDLLDIFYTDSCCQSLSEKKICTQICSETNPLKMFLSYLNKSGKNAPAHIINAIKMNVQSKLLKYSQH